MTDEELLAAQLAEDVPAEPADPAERHLTVVPDPMDEIA
jgi:hypothetical protein